MKKLLITIALFFIILFFTTCKNNPFAGLFNSEKKEADSIYSGKKYYMPAVNRYFGVPLDEHTRNMTCEGVELGRRLFYDKHLSKSGQLSCASCHNYRYALSDSGKQFSTNETGITQRNAPALQNTAWLLSFFWDGRTTTLAAQQKDAFEHELNFKVKDAIGYLATDTIDVRLFKKAYGRPGTINENKIYDAIEQFLLSAVSFNSKFDSVMRDQTKFTPSEYRGYYDVFLTRRGECFHCHQSPVTTILLTDDKFHNNGLDLVTSYDDFTDAGRGKVTHNKTDDGTFKTPGLRNIALTPPYMHDGRFKTLRQVIDFYSDSIKLSPTLDTFLLVHIDTTRHISMGGMHFTEAEKRDLINFLQTLTDQTFINNPVLQNPY